MPLDKIIRGMALGVSIHAAPKASSIKGVGWMSVALSTNLKTRPGSTFAAIPVLAFQFFQAFAG